MILSQFTTFPLKCSFMAVPAVIVHPRSCFQAAAALQEIKMRWLSLSFPCKWHLWFVLFSSVVFLRFLQQKETLPHSWVLGYLCGLLILDVQRKNLQEQKFQQGRTALGRFSVHPVTVRLLRSAFHPGECFVPFCPSLPPGIQSTGMGRIHPGLSALLKAKFPWVAAVWLIT